jgi:hypothetical protein
MTSAALPSSATAWASRWPTSSWEISRQRRPSLPGCQWHSPNSSQPSRGASVRLVRCAYPGLKQCCFALRRPRSNEPSPQPARSAHQGARQRAGGGGGSGRFGGGLRPAVGGGPPGGQLEGAAGAWPAGGPASRGHKRLVSLMPAARREPMRLGSRSGGPCSRRPSAIAKPC